MDNQIETYNGDNGAFDLAKLQQLVYSLNFETELAKASIDENDAEADEYERRNVLLEKEIELVIAETKRCEEEAKSYAERSARGLESIERIRFIKWSLGEQRRKAEAEAAQYEIDSYREMNQMKKVVEDYQKKYDDYVKSFERVHGFDEFIRLQEEVEEQQEAKQAENETEKEKQAAIKKEAEETWARIKENIIAVAQTYHDYHERLKKEKLLKEKAKEKVEEVITESRMVLIKESRKDIDVKKNEEMEVDQEKFDEKSQLLESPYFKKTEDKPPASNSSITITRLEKPDENMLKIDNLDFTKPLSKGRAESVISTISTSSTIKGFEKLKLENNLPRLSSVESFQQFNKKLNQKEYQTSSPLPKIPNFLDISASNPMSTYKKDEKIKTYENKTSSDQTFDVFAKMNNVTHSMEKFHKQYSTIPIPSASNLLSINLPIANKKHEETNLELKFEAQKDSQKPSKLFTIPDLPLKEKSIELTSNKQKMPKTNKDDFISGLKLFESTNPTQFFSNGSSNTTIKEKIDLNNNNKMFESTSNRQMNILATATATPTKFFSGTSNTLIKEKADLNNNKQLFEATSSRLDKPKLFDNTTANLFGDPSSTQCEKSKDINTSFDFSISKRNDDFFNLFNNPTRSNNNDNNLNLFNFNLDDTTTSSSEKTDINQFQKKLNFF